MLDTHLSLQAAERHGISMSEIILDHVSKEYKVAHKEKGLKGVIKNLFYSRKVTIHAVKDISFTINKGEIVGYIGPNGAGKSTTIKMMCGIMNPTEGVIKVGGLSPQKDRKKVVRKLGVVFGQRTQLNWDLRLGESFELLKRIYQIPAEEYRKNLEELIGVLNMTGLLNIPVRQLSLGQRMRGELVAAMLHSPEILFLDEPTIGLDIDAKKAIREFILEINKKRGVTVILTSHDLEDVSRLCNRLIVINDGVIIRDGSIDEIVSDMAPYRLLKLEAAENIEKVKCGKIQIVSCNENKLVCRFDHHRYTASEVIGELSNELSITDLSVEEPDIEEAVAQIYHGGSGPIRSTVE